MLEKKNKASSVAVKEKLIKQVKQVSICGTKLKGEALNGKEIVAGLKIRLMAAQKHAENVVYEREGL